MQAVVGVAHTRLVYQQVQVVRVVVVMAAMLMPLVHRVQSILVEAEAEADIWEVHSNKKQVVQEDPA
jgi:hypothetical protein